jgi:hypothetical protein
LHRVDYLLLLLRCYGHWFKEQLVSCLEARGHLGEFPIVIIVVLVIVNGTTVMHIIIIFLLLIITNAPTAFQGISAIMLLDNCGGQFTHLRLLEVLQLHLEPLLIKLQLFFLPLSFLLLCLSQ